MDSACRAVLLGSYVCFCGLFTTGLPFCCGAWFVLVYWSFGAGVPGYVLCYGRSRCLCFVDCCCLVLVVLCGLVVLRFCLGGWHGSEVSFLCVHAWFVWDLVVSAFDLALFVRIMVG